MSTWVILAIVAGLALVWFAVSKRQEGFEVAFLDNTNEEKTEETRVSSYAQHTNSFKPTESEYEAPPGIETPYRVNLWNSYVPT